MSKETLSNVKGKCTRIVELLNPFSKQGYQRTITSIERLGPTGIRGYILDWVEAKYLDKYFYDQASDQLFFRSATGASIFTPEMLQKFRDEEVRVKSLPLEQRQDNAFKWIQSQMPQFKDKVRA